MITPSKLNIDKLRKSFIENCGLDLNDFRLTFKDIEEEMVELNDSLDFDYMISHFQRKPGNIHIHCSSVNPNFAEKSFDMLEDKLAYNVPIVHIDNTLRKISISDDEKEVFETRIEDKIDSIKQEYGEIVRKDSGYSRSEIESFIENVKTNVVCATNEELNKRLSHLSEKIDQMASLIEQSFKTSKTELKTEINKLESKLQSSETFYTEVHKNIYCNNCKQAEFSGKRFKCLTCYDYDLCETCERMNNHIHPMIRIDPLVSHSDVNTIYKMNVLQEKCGSDFNMQSKLDFLKLLTSQRFSDAFYQKFASQYSTISLEKFMVEMVNAAWLQELSLKMG